MQKKCTYVAFILFVISISSKAQVYLTGTSVEISHRMAAPAQLSEFGIAYFKFEELKSARVVVDLFDRSGLLLATMQLVKERDGGRVSYALMRPNGKAAYVSATSQEDEKHAWFEAIASTGQRLQVKLSLASDTASTVYKWKINNRPLSSVSVYTKGKWKMRSLAAFQSSGKKDQHTTFFLLEEEKQFYNSPELQMLQGVLLNIDNMVKTSLEFSTRLRI